MESCETTPLHISNSPDELFTVDLLRDFLDNANDLIQIVDPVGRYLFVNRHWHETLGYNDAELQDLSVADIIHPDSMKHCMVMFQKVMEGSAIECVDAKFLCKDGSAIDVEGSVSCRFKDGKPLNTRGIFRDITARRRIEAEKELLIKDLREALIRVKTLHGLIPICASCKKIRDDKGYWKAVETYVADHTGAKFTHGFCPDCAGKIEEEIKQY